MERTIQEKFPLTAEEIDRYIEKTAELLDKEKIDKKDALRLRLILEETILNFRDALSEKAEASLRFSRFFGAFLCASRAKALTPSARRIPPSRPSWARCWQTPTR